MGYQFFNTVRRTIRGIEAMKMICKGWIQGVDRGDGIGQIAIFHEIFGVPL
jgi:transposase, IS6 family